MSSDTTTIATIATIHHIRIVPTNSLVPIDTPLVPKWYRQWYRQLNEDELLLRILGRSVGEKCKLVTRRAIAVLFFLAVQVGSAVGIVLMTESSTKIEACVEEKRKRRGREKGKRTGKSCRPAVEESVCYMWKRGVVGLLPPCVEYVEYLVS